MKNQPLDYNDSSRHLALIISKVRTYYDIMNEIAENLNTKNFDNSFWDLVFNALYDLVVIESHKIIDGNKSSVSIFYLMEMAGTISPQNKKEIEGDFEDLKKLINEPNFLLKRHRSTQKAHLAKKRDSQLPRFADLSDVLKLLSISESLIKKYNKWIKGDTYIINFNSMYAGGHKGILDYISRLI